MTRVPHPGWACCDPAQDLAGWIAAERAWVERNRRWARVWHARGRRLNAESIRAAIAGDRDRSEALWAQSRRAHGEGNAFGQSRLIREGHLDRVEAAHQFRLASSLAGVR